jgi:NADPH:quinone reductase-like Zn-dependent oxidoreductase
MYHRRKVGQGALAQYTVAEPETIAAKPSNMTHASASAFPIAGLTAYVSLVNHGGLKRGDGKRIFVNGGRGIGSWAVQVNWTNSLPTFCTLFNCLWQIAKEYGAHVVTTCSPESQSMVKSLGPDAIIDYRSVQPSLSSYLANNYSTSKFDLIFDTVGANVAALYGTSPAYLQPDGIYLDIAGALHIFDNVMSALTTVAGMLNRTMRPTVLGGTPRKYLPLTFWVTSTVRWPLFVFPFVQSKSCIYSDGRAEGMH